MQCGMDQNLESVNFPGDMHTYLNESFPPPCYFHISLGWFQWVNVFNDSLFCDWSFHFISYISRHIVSSDRSSYSDDVLLYICRMFKCSNVSMFHCSNVPMFQCFNVPMFQCSNVPMFQCSNVPKFQCFNVQMFQ